MKKILLALAIFSGVLSFACEYEEILATWTSVAANLPFITHVNNSPAWESVKVTDNANDFVVAVTPAARIFTNTPLTLRIKTFSAGSAGDHHIPVGAFIGEVPYYRILQPPSVNLTFMWREVGGDWQIAGTRKYLDNRQQVISGYDFRFDPGLTSGVIEVAAVAWVYGYSMDYSSSNRGDLLWYDNLATEPQYGTPVISTDITGEYLIPKTVPIEHQAGIYWFGWERDLSFMSIVQVTLLGKRRPK